MKLKISDSVLNYWQGSTKRLSELLTKDGLRNTYQDTVNYLRETGSNLYNNIRNLRLNWRTTALPFAFLTLFGACDATTSTSGKKIKGYNFDKQEGPSVMSSLT